MDKRFLQKTFLLLLSAFAFVLTAYAQLQDDKPVHDINEYRERQSDFQAGTTIPVKVVLNPSEK